MTAQQIDHQSIDSDDDRLDEETVLMAQIAAGDRFAYTILLDRYMTRVFRFAYSLLKDHALAEDVTQEAFLKLWRQADTWRATGRVQSWLLRITHNLCIDEIRSRHPHVDIDSPVLGLPSTPPLQENGLSQAHMAQAVGQALFALPARQRAALMLVYYTGLTNIEAASILQTSVDALESLLARGKRGMRQMLGSQDRF